MPELAELLTRLRHEEEPLARADRILEWAIEELGLQGVALIRAEPSSGVGLRVLRATGSLSGLSAEVVNDLLPAGLPAQSCILALPAALPTAFPTKVVSCGSNGGLSIPDALFCTPLNRQDGVPWSALVLDSNDLSQLTHDHDERLQMMSSLLRDALENEELRRQLRTARTRNGVFALGNATDSHPVAPEIDSLVDGLQLPLYLCDSHGKFLYASAAFLRLTGFATVEALSRATGMFGDPVKRRQELETVLSAGKVSAVPITVTAADGRRLQIQESALSLGDRVLGVFFDVSDLMEANKELKDSLQVQEFLNDSIIAGTRMLRRTQGASIRALARLAEYRNPETGYHLQRICEYARLLAVQVYERAPYSFRITREYGDDISLSSMLHDIGKVSIPDSILLKPGQARFGRMGDHEAPYRVRMGGLEQGGQGAGRAVFPHPGRDDCLVPPREIRRHRVSEGHRRGEHSPLRADLVARRRL